MDGPIDNKGYVTVSCHANFSSAVGLRGGGRE